MRIRRLEVFTARLPLEPGFSHFTGRVTALEEVFVRLTADDGQVGWGEVRGNMSYFSGESPAGIVAALRDYLAPLVVGRPLRERGGAIAEFDRALAGNAAAKAVLDIALHDLAARRAGVPLYRWPGGRRAERVAGSECLFYGPADEAAAQARAYVAQGFRILKVRVGLEPFALDVARVRAVARRWATRSASPWTPTRRGRSSRPSAGSTRWSASGSTAWSSRWRPAT